MSCEISGISSMATRLILAELATGYERRSGCRAAIVAMGGVEAARLVRAGEPTDIVVLASDVMRQLESGGHLRAGSRADVARSGIAVAVRSGAPRPDIHDGASMRQAVMEGGRIGYSTGPSGDHLLELFETWGVRSEIERRLVKATPGVPVGSLLAAGEVDIAFQQLSELMNVAGIDVVGPLPADIQSVTTFSAGISGTSRQPDEARGLIAYLTSPETAETKRRHGMEPA